MSEYRNGLSAIKALYDEYISEVEQLERSRKPADGLLGLGRKIADGPCHDRFSERLRKMLDDYAAEKPDTTDIRGVLEYIYSVHTEHKDPVSVYWLLNAVHGFTEKLVGMLSREDASALFEFYEKKCPRSERFPVQKKVLKALKSAAK